MDFMGGGMGAGAMGAGAMGAGTMGAGGFGDSMGTEQAMLNQVIEESLKS